MAKNKQTNLITSIKMLSIGFINKCIVSSGIVGAIKHKLIANHISQMFFYWTPQIFFFIKCTQNRLLRMSFIELQNFMIYQHVNERTKILPLATSHIAHLCNQFNHVCSANFYAMF